MLGDIITIVCIIFALYLLWDWVQAHKEKLRAEVAQITGNIDHLETVGRAVAAKTEAEVAMLWAQARVVLDDIERSKTPPPPVSPLSTTGLGGIEDKPAMPPGEN